MKYKKRLVEPQEIDAFPVIECEVTITDAAGTQIARHGDWVIRGVRGELTVVKKDYFIKNYETVP